MQGRCAAVQIFRDKLAILPAMGAYELDVVMEVEEPANGGPTKPTTVGNSVICGLAKFGVKEVGAMM